MKCTLVRHVDRPTQSRSPDCVKRWTDRRPGRPQRTAAGTCPDLSAPSKPKHNRTIAQHGAGSATHRPAGPRVRAVHKKILRTRPSPARSQQPRRGGPGYLCTRSPGLPAYIDPRVTLESFELIPRQMRSTSPRSRLPIRAQASSASRSVKDHKEKELGALPPGRESPAPEPSAAYHRQGHDTNPGGDGLTSQTPRHRAETAGL